jgi:hypothetical protein
LFVNANTWQAAFRFGQNDFSDAHNSPKIDHLIVNNAGSGYALRLNYVLNADIFTIAVTAGSAGLVMDQVQFSKISGAASATAGTAMLIERGYTFANTISAIDLEVAQVGLTITSPYANRNTFVSPYFKLSGADCRGRRLQQPAAPNPSYGAAQPPTMSSLVGVVSIP